MAIAGKTLDLNTIGEAEAVNDSAYLCHPYQQEYLIVIKKSLSKMFVLHGQKYTPDLIEAFAESLIDTYKHESPKTILLFLRKAGAGDFGKFFGGPDIGTLREWFADFLMQSIIPARERERTANKESYDSRREQIQSPKEYLQSGGAKPITGYLTRTK